VDSHDNIIVVGTTTSNDFPVTDGSTSSGKDGGDNFIARFDPDGQVIYSFYYATNEINSINSVEKTPVGEIVLAGGTSSTSFYCSEDAFQQELRGETDGFIRVLGEDLETIVFSTYLGGSGDDTILNLAVGQDGSIFISGSTKSDDFPVTENCIQSEYGGGSRDSFVAKVDPSRHLVMGTYLGGSDQEDIFGISEGPESVIVVGRTWSSDFPTTTNAYQHEYSKVEVDGFLCQISMLGDELLYSTFYGLNDWDSLLQVNVDNEGKFIITGFVGSGGFETVNAFQPEYMGLSDIIVMVWGKEIELISYLGSYELEHPFAQTISDGKMFIVGVTSSTQFQVSDNAYQTTHAGGDEGFIWVMDYQTYLSGEILDLDGKDASGSNFRLYISYGVVIGGIVLWFVYIKRSFAESY
jgi:hypothetical protein